VIALSQFVIATLFAYSLQVLQTEQQDERDENQPAVYDSDSSSDDKQAKAVAVEPPQEQPSDLFNDVEETEIPRKDAATADADVLILDPGLLL
jgi:hypothetical protein